MDNNALPDDVWAAARLIWENTVKITDSELIEQLTVSFGDAAPKSTGTISKRRSKHKWKKNTLAEATKRQSKQGRVGIKVGIMGIIKRGIIPLFHRKLIKHKTGIIRPHWK